MSRETLLVVRSVAVCELIMNRRVVYGVLGLALLAGMADLCSPARRSVAQGATEGDPRANRRYLAAEFGLPVDGTTDAQGALIRCFKAAAGGGLIVIPPGDYLLSGREPIPLSSGLTIHAEGARFNLPRTLPDRARIVLFQGTNIRDLRWIVGHFEGRCFDPELFDPDHPDACWPPNANTRAILIQSTIPGGTVGLHFREVTGNSLAGAAITVEGLARKGSERDVDAAAEHVVVENCRLLRTGKFMWDYGYLWQIVVWPEEFGPAERAMAATYFRNDLIRDAVRFTAGDTKIRFNNHVRLPISRKDPPALEADRGHDSLCFFGDTLPPELVRGRQYFVVASESDHIEVSATRGGEPIRFTAAGGPNVRLIHNLFQAHLALYAPKGAGPGKGAVDITSAKHVRVTGCTLSALGDTMHIQRCEDVVFANNQIVGSRMGAFFIAEFCRNVTVTGNTVDGTNGSRVMSVEKSTRDITITGNTFRGGGRGSWINQPVNFVLTDNVFVNNTTKCDPDPRRGRRTFLTGDYERYAELYFTIHEPEGRYGSVIVRNNIFENGPGASAAITFERGARGVIVRDNLFKGRTAQVVVSPGCEAVDIGNNTHLED